ncbi:factor of DNA methylation 1-like isoform X2 [Punica granatum]|uniref:Factor of DNA methylation 1-like isoform X2 n=1 Tax=Punica granatum TaxID=22663 RepID=A0A6P8CDA1_PUNGR|nr:factor of DNA methylation 1-like isoform X2 [Punica granatum]
MEEAELRSYSINKERELNDELGAARKVLIEGMQRGLLGAPTNIGLKRLGQIDSKPFEDACRERFPPEKAESQAAALTSLWMQQLSDPGWYPIKMIEEVIDEQDEKLQKLRQEFGEEPYKAVVTALMEINEHNASGRYTVTEIWNFRENRKASLKEVIEDIMGKIERGDLSDIMGRITRADTGSGSV